MPKRNQSSSGRRGSTRHGANRPFSAKATHRGKSSLKRADDSSGERPSGKRRDSRKNVSPSATGRRPKFQKTFDSKGSRRGDAAAGGSDTFASGRKDFKGRKGEGNFSPRKKGRFHAGAGSTMPPRPEKRVGAPDQRPANLNRRAPGPQRPGKMGFARPYKKSYRTKAVHETAGNNRYPRKNRQDITDKSTVPKSDKIRLNKFIANSGVSSRREADNLITMGLISVNGKVVSELGYKVNPGDEVRYEDKVLHAEKPVYILMNKPKGFLTTTDDPQERKTVMHLIGPAVKERIYPVGRLDRNTTGLLLLTNDGDLADKLMHPSFNISKIYKVELDKPLTNADFQAIAEGVRLDEGRATVDDLAYVSDDKRTIGIELHIGWNRVVRRIFENLGYEVLKLDRTAYAGLDKKDLGRGQWRFLSKEEIIQLKHFK